METSLLEINEVSQSEVLERLDFLIDLILNLNNWLEILVTGLIALLIVYLFYLALKNFI